MTTVAVDLPAGWLAADLAAEPREWARSAVRRQAREQDLDLTAGQAERLAEVMLPALESARREDVPPVMVLFLLPVADRPVVCSVTVRAEGVQEDTSAQELLQEIRLPAEMLEQPALEEIVETRCGPAAHLLQRYRAPQGVDFELVQEHELFLWRVADAEGDWAIYLSTGALDLVAAAQWRPALLELATMLTVTPDENPLT